MISMFGYLDFEASTVPKTTIEKNTTNRFRLDEDEFLFGNL
jgi:hypothetical protein